jgi:nicotinate-nucleotide adenylyltransferase
MVKNKLPLSQHIYKKRVGFFSGVFDPIHNGHLEVARSAVKHLSLDKVYFMLEEQAWGDKSPINKHHRRAMIDLAIKEYSKIEQLVLKDKQFDIAHTLTNLETKFPKTELYFIFGADVFMNMNFKQWPGLERLFEHYIVVFERGPIRETDITKHAFTLGVAVAILPSAHPLHTSTNVRLKPHAKAIWVPKKVADYIDQNNLYSSSDSGL